MGVLRGKYKRQEEGKGTKRKHQHQKNKRKRHDTKSTCEGFHTKPMYGRFWRRKENESKLKWKRTNSNKTQSPKQKKKKLHERKLQTWRADSSARIFKAMRSMCLHPLISACTKPGSKNNFPSADPPSAEFPNSLLQKKGIANWNSPTACQKTQNRLPKSGSKVSGSRGSKLSKS